MRSVLSEIFANCANDCSIRASVTSLKKNKVFLSQSLRLSTDTPLTIIIFPCSFSRTAFYSGDWQVRDINTKASEIFFFFPSMNRKFNKKILSSWNNLWILLIFTIWYFPAWQKNIDRNSFVILHTLLVCTASDTTSTLKGTFLLWRDNALPIERIANPLCGC